MYYYQKELLNKILEGKIDINNFFITMPRRAGRSYLINLWQEMRLQLLKKLWQEFELKYFYIINHRKYMIDINLIKQWLIQKLVKKGVYITPKDIEINILNGNIKISDLPLYLQEMTKQYIGWKKDPNSVLNTMFN